MLTFSSKLDTPVLHMYRFSPNDVQLVELVINEKSTYPYKITITLDSGSVIELFRKTAEEADDVIKVIEDRYSEFHAVLEISSGNNKRLILPRKDFGYVLYSRLSSTMTIGLKNGLNFDVSEVTIEEYEKLYFIISGESCKEFTGRGTTFA